MNTNDIADALLKSYSPDRRKCVKIVMDRLATTGLDRFDLTPPQIRELLEAAFDAGLVTALKKRPNRQN